MAEIRPFAAYRPTAEAAAVVAALPYDVYSREEARAYVAAHPDSFLAIDRAETTLPKSVDIYAPEVYAHAAELLQKKIDAGVFVQDDRPCYYLYEQTFQGRTQTGIVALASIDEYCSGVIVKHENTVEAKEQDRIHHVDACSAQTGPIFLTYRHSDGLRALVNRVRETEPVYDFTTEEGVGTRVFVISDGETIGAISEAFAGIPHLYIADGHHRAASAAKVGLKRREEHPEAGPEAEFNYFLSVLFPDDELAIMDYDRVVLGKCGRSKNEILAQIRRGFQVMPLKEAVRPRARGEIGMYMDGTWYLLSAMNRIKTGDPVRGLDVSLLQAYILGPIFGIRNPRTDSRIQFIGGIRGIEALEESADKSGGVAFLMYPTSVEELLRAADAGKLMPPKSTWFEPKLLSGLFIHRF